MTTDGKQGEIPKKWRYLSDAALALCIASGAFGGLILFAFAKALEGLGAGLAGSSGVANRVNDLIEFVALTGGGALLGCLPGYALRYWVRKAKRGQKPD